MAATSKGTKSRLDFGAALNSALFVDSNPQNEEETQDKNTAEISIDVKMGEHQLHEEELVTHISENGMTGEMSDTAAPMEVEEQVEAAQPLVQKRRVPVATKPKEKIAPQMTAKANVNDVFAALAKNERGFQKSIYLENDVYRFIQEKSTTYNVNFSNIVNMLLRDAISNYTN